MFQGFTTVPGVQHAAPPGLKEAGMMFAVFYKHAAPLERRGCHIVLPNDVVKSIEFALQTEVARQIQECKH